MKLKTHKALIKRVRLTKRRKVMKRAANQNHFNSKDTGEEGRKKRRDIRLSQPDERNVLKAIH